MNAAELKQKFSHFYVSKGYKSYPPSSLIPKGDSSVLFTTAGMQQFKRYFLQPATTSDKKIVTIQPCLRTTDIDEVGDENHLTYFEMLGNFSFGEKNSQEMKKRAIKEAWEFLTDELKIARSRISAAYFKGEKNLPADKESLAILREIDGLKKIIGQGLADNFWSLGTENSPAGPTVEFYIDAAEIWNLVFNEYILRNGKWKMENGKCKGVDTGMGLERLLQVLNKYESVFDSDLYNQYRIKITDYRLKIKDCRIILDHLRSAEALINEGLEPSNKEQGYVFRRLIRRVAVILKKNKIEFEKIIDNQIILAEINKFNQTLDRGLKFFNQAVEKREIDGKIAFDLFQTYGFPIDLTMELAKEKGLKINEEEFEKELAKHQELSRTASTGMFKSGLAEENEMTKKYHTATHLLLAALNKVLGGGVTQKGSNITAERLRFDFNCNHKLSAEEIKEIEKTINQWISDGYEIKKETMTLAEAKKSAASGVFEERYDNNVTVYTIAKDEQIISREICAGPHVTSTADLGKFQISKEEASSAGVRRIRAKLT